MSRGILDDRIFTDVPLFDVIGAGPRGADRTNLLTSRLMLVPSTRARFVAAVKDLLAAAFTRETVEARTASLLCGALPDLMLDQRKRWPAPAAFAAEVHKVVAFVEARTQVVVADLERITGTASGH